MSVVFRRSPGKMILKNNTIITAVIFCIGFIQNIFCASYSKVYVHSGADVQPYQYYNYGAPAVSYGPQLSRLSASPVGSVVPLPRAASFVTPCVPAPCVPTPPIAPMANAGLVAYKAPSLPIVVTGEEPAPPYEYSYVVYDENTGDQKTLRELSDGLVVRGQYSLLQPDGYVREVQYTADDTTGFNAIVRKFLPGSEVRTFEMKPKDCGDQNAALKEEVKIPAPEASKQSETPPRDEEHRAAPAPAEAPTRELVEIQKIEPKGESQGEAPTLETQGVQEKTKVENAPAPPKQQSEVVSAEVIEEKVAKPKETVTEQAESAEPTKPPGTERESVEEQAVAVQPVQPQNFPQGVIVGNPQPISYSTYNQLMRCIQAMKNAEQQRYNSPLSYILLPSNSLPC